VAQAYTLDALFTNLVRRAQPNMDAGYLTAVETFMKLALRAQHQCRATLETLSAIKNPPVVFARQANIAQNQQVNNGEHEVARRKSENPPTELMEVARESQWLDSGAKSASSAGDPYLEAVERSHGSTDAAGKGKG